MSEQEIERHLRFVMRQLEGGIHPQRVPMTAWLKERTTEAIAQSIYERLLTEHKIKTEK